MLLPFSAATCPQIPETFKRRALPIELHVQKGIARPLHRRQFLKGAAAFAATGVQSAVAQEAEQCPSGGQEFFPSGTVDGVSFQASGSSLTMTNTTTSEMATVSWCAEGSGNLSNGSNTSGVMSSGIPGGESWSTSFDDDVSRLVIYGVEHQASGGHRPPPRPGSGGGGDGDVGGEGGGGSGGGGGGGGTPPTGNGPGAPGAVAPPPAAIPAQPTVTG